MKTILSPVSAVLWALAAQGLVTRVEKQDGGTMTAFLVHACASLARGPAVLCVAVPMLAYGMCCC